MLRSKKSNWQKRDVEGSKERRDERDETQVEEDGKEIFSGSARVAGTSRAC